VGPRAGLDDLEKRKFLTLPGLELRPLSVVQPVASRYTDYAIPAPQIVGSVCLKSDDEHFLSYVIHDSSYRSPLYIVGVRIIVG
jgi:hypothetical protein